MTTVDEKKSMFSVYDFSVAKLAQSIQCHVGPPSVRDFIHYIENNLIPNCPMTTQDITNADFIWGPDIGNLKGKIVCSKLDTVSTQLYTIPLKTMQQ
jgi:hypothetical protein